MIQKVTVYKLSDGRTVDSREAAVREQLKLDVLERMKSLLEKHPGGLDIAKAVIGSMINAGWRPPVAKREASQAPAIKRGRPPKAQPKPDVSNIPTLGERNRTQSST